MKESEQSILQEAAATEEASQSTSAQSTGQLESVLASTWQGELPNEVFVIMMKYLDIGMIAGKILVLNRKLHDLVQSENYLLFKHFLRDFNILNDRLKRMDTPA